MTSSVYFSDYFSETWGPEDTVCYSVPHSGLSSKILKTIQKGDYGIDDTIDLHGETIDTARDNLAQHLEEAYNQQCRCLLIIHGKGQAAKLKNHVIHWLKQAPWILFFCSAQPKHGGAGALYVLLKKNRHFPAI